VPERTQGGPRRRGGGAGASEPGEWEQRGGDEHRPKERDWPECARTPPLHRAARCGEPTRAARPTRRGRGQPAPPGRATRSSRRLDGQWNEVEKLVKKRRTPARSAPSRSRTTITWRTASARRRAASPR
jgi:hypothetical protein